MAPPDRIVVAGAGRSGIAVAEQLRRDGFAGSIDIVGAETWLPYERPLVSKGLLDGTVGEERATLPASRRLADIDVTLHSGRRVTLVDATGRAVDLDDGRRLAYDELVIATGTRARMLPGVPESAPNVCTLRTRDDVERVRGLIAGEGTVVVIGAGFIGSEVASTLGAAGVPVALVDPALLPLSRAVGDSLARRIVDAASEAGTQMHLGRVVRDLRVGADGRVTSAELDDGTVIVTSAVIVAAGSVPVTPWGDEPAGIRVDGLGRTSTPGVWACGDVAAWRWESIREQRRVEHWLTALGQGRAVARGIMGATAPYDDAPVFWSDQFGMRLQRIGHAAADGSWIDEESAGAAACDVTWMHDAAGRVTGAAVIDRPDVIVELRRGLAAVA